MTDQCVQTVEAILAQLESVSVQLPVLVNQLLPGAKQTALQVKKQNEFQTWFKPVLVANGYNGVMDIYSNGFQAQFTTYLTSLVTKQKSLEEECNQYKKTADLSQIQLKTCQEKLLKVQYRCKNIVSICEGDNSALIPDSQINSNTGKSSVQPFAPAAGTFSKPNSFKNPKTPASNIVTSSSSTAGTFISESPAPSLATPSLSTPNPSKSQTPCSETSTSSTTTQDMSTGNKTEVAPTMPAADAPVFKRKRQKVWTSRRKDDDISTLFMPINQAREIWRRPRKRFPDIGIELGAARNNDDDSSSGDSSMDQQFECKRCGERVTQSQKKTHRLLHPKREPDFENYRWNLPNRGQ